MYRTANVVLGVLLGLLWSAGAAAASFPCEKAQTRIEKAICADKEVSDLDEYLGRYYARRGRRWGARGNACARTSSNGCARCAMPAPTRRA